MVPAPLPSSTTARASLPGPPAPKEAWVLAPLIAGQPFYKAGRWLNGKFHYPRPTTLPRLTRALPAQVAAVMVHGVDGTVATLCLDLDTSKAAPAVVRADAERLCRILAEAGLRWVEDFSPSGGRHLYIPLGTRLEGAAARELVEALTLVAPSLDPGPHQNPVEGCIRVPGSVHKSGGHQTLITPLSEAYDVLRRRNPAAALERFRAALAPELRRHRELKARRTTAAATMLQLPVASATSRTTRAGSGMESPLRIAARTGLYDTARYQSPSEARMAVLNHLAACGWTLEQVRLELTGQLAGLASLYGTTEKQARLLQPEWDKALTFISRSKKPAPAIPRKKTASICDTSPPLTSRPGQNLRKELSDAGIHQLVNDLENILYALLDHRMQKLGREGLGLRLLLRALLGYMRSMETNVLDVGCRTLAVALGKHHGTVARLLPRLAALSDGILSKIEDAHHKRADVYLIELPAQYAQLAKELSWRKGKIYGIRPVFRALGDPAALVYEAIERGRHSPTTAEIVRMTGISRAAVDRAADDMAALAMIHRDNGTWRVTLATSLTQLAIRLGVMDDHWTQILLYRLHRGQWHAWLDRDLPEQQPREEDLYDAERDEHWLPPPDAAEPANHQAHIYQAA